MTKTHFFGIAVIALATVALAIIIWGFDKGFILSDGGFYVLRYQQNQPIGPCDFSFEHILVKAVIPLSWRTIKSLRYIGLCLSCICSLLFALSIAKVYHKMHGRRIGSSLLWLMMLAAFVLPYTGMPSELSYNNLTQFFLISSTAFLLLSMLDEGVNSHFMACLAGLSCSMLFMTKLPSGIAMTLVSSFILTLSGPTRLRRVIVFLGALAISLLLCNFLLKLGFAERYYCAFFSRGGEGTIHNKSLLLKSIFDAIIMFVKTFAIATPIIAAFWLASLKSSSKLIKSLCWSSGLFIITVYFSIHIADHVMGFYVQSKFFLMIIFLMLLAWLCQDLGIYGGLSSLASTIKQHRRFLPAGLLLILVPYIGAWGSAIPLNDISRFYFVSFIGLIALLLPLLRFKHTKLAIVGVSLYLITVGLYHYVQHPFVIKPLYHQTEAYKGIKYDPESAVFFKRTENALNKHGFNKKQGLVVAYTAPGLVYLMDTFQPGGVLWKEERQGEYFRRLKKNPLKLKPVVISLTGVPDEKFISGFNDATGLDFERDYWLSDEYKSYYRFSTAYVYFPYSNEIRDDLN